MKTLIITALIIMSGISTSYAQLGNGDNLIGGTIGLWPNNSATTLGFNYENQVITTGVATLGLGAMLRYSNVSRNVPQDYSNTFIGGQANFNFNQIGTGKFVPFVGLVLGVYTSNLSTPKENGFWTWGQAGMRYFFSPNVAGVARFGLGNFDFNSMEVGVDFKF
ncbi:MAG: hypothetical protein JSS91_05125 [Bacteroidetes bacterium]|nr:hypothetical protein [Bacteroidota bacterium]